MFHTTLTRLAARCAAAIDDLLAADFDGFDQQIELSGEATGLPAQPLAYHREHPHRVPMRSTRERRPGRVRSAPAHCLSPTRAATGSARREPVHV